MNNAMAAGMNWAHVNLKMGQTSPDHLVHVAEHYIGQCLEREYLESAEYWVGVKEHANLKILSETPQAQRQAQADYEMVFCLMDTGEEAMWFCEREDTIDLARDLQKRKGVRNIIVRPAFFEECGAMCLLNVGDDES